MSDELRAAAERLAGRDLADYQGPTGDDTDMRAGITLARAYLASHPPDDAEPVTEEWMRAAGFWFKPDDMGGCDYWVIGDPCETMPQTLSHCPSTGSWTYGCCGVVPPKTRGDVRRLCSALGVKLAEVARTEGR